MAKSSKRQFKAAMRRRLSVERLETRTVLSATNLLSTIIDINYDVEDRFELESRSAFIASQVDTEDASAHGPFANQLETQSGFANELELLRAGPIDWAAAHPEIIEAPMDWPYLPIWPIAAEDHSYQRVTLIRDTASIGELAQPPAALLVSTLDNMDARPQIATFDRSALFSMFPEAADSSTRAIDNPDRSEFFERRANLEVEERFAPPLTDNFNDQGKLFADRLGEGGLVDIDDDRPELSTTNHDRVFEALAGHSRQGHRDSVPESRPGQVLRRATVIGDELSSLTEQTVAVSLAVDVALQQLAGSLIELPSQEFSALRDSLAGQLLYSTNDDQVAPLSRQMHGGKGLLTTQINTWLDVATQGLAVQFSAKWIADTSLANLANKVPQSDGGLVELDINLAEQPKTIRRAIADPLPHDETWWHEAARHADESFWLEFSDDVESRLATTSAQQPDRTTEKHDAETHLTHTTTEVNVDEGGMIELIAAADPNTRQPSSQPTSRSDVPRETPEKVRMDTGVGMFQVFEIATSPQGSTNDAALTANEIAPPVETTSVNVTDATPPAEQAAAISDNADAEPIRAASLPALLAAASLLFKRRKRSDDELAEARQGRR